MSDNEKPTTHHDPVGTRPGPVEDHLGDEPPHHGMSAGQYIASRFSSLKPPMSKLPNPFSLLRMLNGHHWAFFMVAFFAWVCGDLGLIHPLMPICVQWNTNADQPCTDLGCFRFLHRLADCQ